MSLLFNLLRQRSLTNVPRIYRNRLLTTNSFLQNTCKSFVPGARFYSGCTGAVSKLLLPNHSNMILMDKQCRSASWKLFSYKNPDHSSHWIVERYGSFLLLFMLPAAFYYQTETLDMLLSILMSYHLYLGLDTIVQDYVRENVFGSLIPKVSRVALLFAFTGLAYGLLTISFTDAGLTGSIAKIWHAL